VTQHPAPALRLRLDLAYDGTDFSGWARQPDRRTVAQVVEEALQTVLRLPETPVLTVAGRTDAGVHAAGQVAHVDLPARPPTNPPPSPGDNGDPGDRSVVDPDLVLRRLQGLLPEDVTVRAVCVAPPGFDARFAALGRHYRYRIADAAPNPLRRRDTLTWPRTLDVEAMAVAASGLVGMHDFAAYCRPRPGATTTRSLHALTVAREEPGVVGVAAHADAFCHHQVRSMVGALIAVGEGRRAPQWPSDVLASRVRDSAVSVAPAHGLTLVAVDYPDAALLAARTALTRRRRDDPLD
jgi:tRNA pseudouridine38-40 synthase